MPTLTVTLRGHLLVAGGQAADLGVDLTTARRFDGHGMVPYIPATALRGAIRMQLESLLRGARRAAAGPYPAAGAPEPDDPVARLFGTSGPLRRRDQACEGALRFGDALPPDGAAARAAVRAALAIRPGLEIADATGSASSGKLFFREVADLTDEPLVFSARLSIRAAEPDEREQRQDDLVLLRAAVAATDALGAGKSKGGGGVSIAWSDEEAGPAAVLAGVAQGAASVRLAFTLREPAHFGDGGPRGNHHATRHHIPGATVRGALAWALLRGGKLVPESAEFRALFLDAASPVSFGDALLAATPEEEAAPVVRAATARHRRGGTGAVEDSLALDLARDRVNRLLAGSGRYLRADDGDRRFDPAKTHPEDGLVRRIRTRVSIDRWSGAAADGRLFSIEQIEPWLFDEAAVAAGEVTVAAGEATEGAPQAPAARFVSIVEGPAAALGHLALLEGQQVLVGAGRNHGLGEVALEVRFEPAPAAGEDPLSPLLALSRKVDALAADLARRAGLGGAGALPPGATLPVALVALSDYLPSGDGRHPLAEPALAGPELLGLAPVRRVLNPGASGGYDQRPGQAPLKDLLPAIGAGSAFIYEIERSLAGAFAALLPALRRGVGSRVESGCGRFAPLDPSPTTTGGRPMSVDLAPSIKSRLVGRAETILDTVKNEKGFRDQTSQLRNMLQIVQTESEISVLRNFIRYQTGRKATKKFWLLIHEGVLAVLVEIGAEFSEVKARRAALQSFFGYLVRHYVYLSEAPRPLSAGGTGTGHGTASGSSGGAASGGGGAGGGSAGTSGGASRGAPAGAAPPTRKARG
jgi:CRISPR/Cas system CSM-associated protein Csm3 (group 7 of RAMP superfamily)